MSTPSPKPQRPRFEPAAWRPSRRIWLWVLLAFVGGLVLFALVLSGGRKDDFYRADRAPPTSAGPVYTPLPAPLPAGRTDEGSGMDEPRPDRASTDDEPRPRLVETAPPPPAAPVAPAPSQPLPMTTSSQPVPIPGQTPAPRYPAQALRRDERGTVLVRAEIGPDGVPTSVSVVRGSGSRTLDRAATDAVRRWRFRPAQLNGQPTVGSVQVPIEFNPR